MVSSGGMSGAAAGASMGMAFGPWGAAIGGVAGYFIGDSQGAKVEKQRAKAIEAQAELMRKEMARVHGETRRARTMEILNTAEAINYIKRTSGQIKADISVQTSAADVIGASALAAYTDADAQRDNAKAQAFRNLEYTLDNQGVQLDSAFNKSFLSTRSMIEQSKSQDTSQKDMWAGVLGLAETGGSLWSSGAFKGGAPKGNNASSMVGTYSKTGYKSGIGPGR